MFFVRMGVPVFFYSEERIEKFSTTPVKLHTRYKFSLRGAAFPRGILTVDIEQNKYTSYCRINRVKTG